MKVFTLENLKTVYDELAVLLEEWESIADYDGYGHLLITDIEKPVNTSVGLCYTVLYHAFSNRPDLAEQHLWNTFDGYSGCYHYPVGGEYEYEEEYCENLYRNPERKRLAKHCYHEIGMMIRLWSENPNYYTEE